MKVVFKPRPVLPSQNPFPVKGVPKDYLLVCTSDSCFCRSVFDDVVQGYRDIAPASDDVLVRDTILFVSPSLAAIVEKNPNLAPSRY